ncbi:hypothetical protein BT96DRAFT_924109 [Gymnopus androsaceus JB14]|uniref:Uncharacterized protein n=1 Tax=Gymnopus androsaceus JB14 TaxID=1447944 RepID=A0A6A4H800_9AGAR|nr:hypothetical protein BT96DRAFT_924109 [Gymnopus androsaceus JB14]
MESKNRDIPNHHISFTVTLSISSSLSLMDRRLSFFTSVPDELCHHIAVMTSSDTRSLCALTRVDSRFLRISNPLLYKSVDTVALKTLALSLEDRALAASNSNILRVGHPASLVRSLSVSDPFYKSRGQAVTMSKLGISSDISVKERKEIFNGYLTKALGNLSTFASRRDTDGNPVPSLKKLKLDFRNEPLEEVFKDVDFSPFRYTRIVLKCTMGWNFKESCRKLASMLNPTVQFLDLDLTSPSPTGVWLASRLNGFQDKARSFYGGEDSADWEIYSFNSSALFIFPLAFSTRRFINALNGAHFRTLRDFRICFTASKDSMVIEPNRDLDVAPFLQRNRTIKRLAYSGFNAVDQLDPKSSFPQEGVMTALPKLTHFQGGFKIFASQQQSLLFGVLLEAGKGLKVLQFTADDNLRKRLYDSKNEYGFNMNTYEQIVRCCPKLEVLESHATLNVIFCPKFFPLLSMIPSLRLWSLHLYCEYEEEPPESDEDDSSLDLLPVRTYITKELAQFCEDDRMAKGGLVLKIILHCLPVRRETSGAYCEEELEFRTVRYRRPDETMGTTVRSKVIS